MNVLVFKLRAQLQLLQTNKLYCHYYLLINTADVHELSEMLLLLRTGFVICSLYKIKQNVGYVNFYRWSHLKAELLTVFCHFTVLIASSCSLETQLFHISFFVTGYLLVNHCIFNEQCSLQDMLLYLCSLKLTANTSYIWGLLRG